MAIMDLFRPQWKHSNKLIRQAAIGKITNQKLLSEIVATEKEIELRFFALEKIGDQNELVKIARSTDIFNLELKAAAVDKLVDKKLLLDIIYNDQDSMISTVAINKISDKQLLEKIFCFFGRNKNYDGLKAVINKSNDQKFFFKIVCGDYSAYFNDLDTHFSIGVEALHKIKDQNYLYYVATCSNMDSSYRKDAITKITDQNILKKIASDKKLVKVFYEPYFGDPNDYYKCDEVDLRILSIKKINDLEFLSKIALDKSEIIEISEAATQKISNNVNATITMTTDLDICTIF